MSGMPVHQFRQGFSQVLTLKDYVSMRGYCGMDELMLRGAEDSTEALTPWGLLGSQQVKALYGREPWLDLSLWLRP